MAYKDLCLGCVLILLCGCSTVLQNAHSHNDYLQANPLHDAMAHRFISVETDVLLKNGKLYVGHHRSDLSNPDIRDLETLYLKPLHSEFLKNGGYIYPGYKGPFYLWIDIKYDGERVYKLLRDIIVPYHEMLFSTISNRGGKVMIILSGDRPIDQVLSDSAPYLHLDGRPDDLGGNLPSERMPFVSQHINLVCRINDEQFLDPEEFSRLKAHVELCHQQDKKVRLWASPESPQLWSQLIDAKVDLINTDSLKKLADYFYE